MIERIIFVTDDAIGDPLVDSLRAHGFEVSIETRCHAAYQQALASPPHLLVLDVANAVRAIELLKRVRSAATLNKTPVLVLAEWGTGQATVALTSGADVFEPKPIDAARLIAAVERCLRPRLVMAAVPKN